MFGKQQFGGRQTEKAVMKEQDGKGGLVPGRWRFFRTYQKMAAPIRSCLNDCPLQHGGILG